MQPLVVVNPAAANGRLSKHVDEIAAQLRKILGPYELLRTEYGGHATHLVATALQDGVEQIISVGGDGTHNEVANGFFAGKQLRNPDAILGILPYGTGTDLGRSLGIRRGKHALEILVKNSIRTIDVGCVTYGLPDGGEAVRYFLNVADFGMGGEVVKRVNGASKFFGGFLSFLWGVLATLAVYPNPVIHIEIDGEPTEGFCSNVIVANGQYYGGGMHVAPEARLDSGVFEVYVIGDVGRIEAVLNLPKLYRGHLLKKADKVTYHIAHHVVARSKDRVLLNLDGEQPGQLPATFEILPRALPILS